MAEKKELSEEQEGFLAKRAELEKVIKSFKCANPQKLVGSIECDSKVGVETATGEIACAKCGWIMNLNKEQMAIVNRPEVK
jgi:RNase P subunit RPR2